jgi:hypothetical protein
MMSGASSTTQSSPMPSTSSFEQVNTPCIFCGEVGNKSKLRRAAILGLDKKVKECAQVLGDKHLVIWLLLMQFIIVHA